MLNSNFSPWPSFTEEEADAVAMVVRSNRVNYWTGSCGREFESEFARWAGTSHGIAVANGTVALDLALHGLGIGRANGGRADDEVVVTPRTFLASVSCVVNAGARPVFADVDAESGNMTAKTISAVLTDRCRAIIVVHLGGWPADMQPIMELSEARGIKVVEDCAQAHGALYQGKSVGSIGHVGAWSFCQDKIMTTGGEGGMVTTNDPGLWSKMWSFKDHGKSWEAVYEREHGPGFRWLHESFGTNWRMIEMQAVIGSIQLRRMSAWTSARANNAAILQRALTPFACLDGIIREPQTRYFAEDSTSRHANYKFYFYVRPDRLRAAWSRDRIVAEVNARGVPCFTGSCSEVYLERAFDGTDMRPSQPLPVARELGETSVMMLVHPTLSADEMARAATVIGDVLYEASEERANAFGVGNDMRRRGAASAGR
jgi:dTDP-4-amino-4,6-dideoxygalactose transaminase